jgi:TetR/AcrR family tetracycline transcriptional repressor
MAKLERDTVVKEALDLLDEVGLDAVSTRSLAKRLGVEQPSLYWHFRNKGQLLAAMAVAAMRPHVTVPLPSPPDDWQDWFLENNRNFRKTLLLRRDGARLHAGSRPAGTDLERAVHKVAFLIASGIPKAAAQTAMLASSRFTVGSVLEEQADPGRNSGAGEKKPPEAIDHNAAFEAGLKLILRGLQQSALSAPPNSSHRAETT